jgi:diketogulonate reductase-like aldo/keto reductase
VGSHRRAGAQRADASQVNVIHELCKAHGIILLAFASLGHGLEPRLLDDAQRGSAVLTASVTPSRIQENFDVVALPQEGISDTNERLETRFRFDSVADGGEPSGIRRSAFGPLATT